MNGIESTSSFVGDEWKTYVSKKLRPKGEKMSAVTNGSKLYGKNMKKAQQCVNVEKCKEMSGMEVVSLLCGGAWTTHVLT